MKTIFTLLVALFITGHSQLYAHALWIETNYSGKTGQPHEVKLFYGEYASNEREETSKWYSDVKDCTLWLVGPDKQKTQLKTTLNANYVAANFTPQKEGLYTLLVSHDAKELGGTTRYEFLASTTVSIGSKSGNVDPLFNTGALKVFPATGIIAKTNTPVKLKAILNDSVKVKKAISVFSPSGWSKEIVTGVDGIAEFIPLWPGKYVVEVTDYKKTTGEHHGKTYSAMWKGATYSFDVID